MSKQTTSPRLTGQFAKALVYAEAKHHAQTRKGGANVPYIGHLLSVASLVIEAAGDETQAIAALLHDAAEDAGGTPTLEEIRANFGDEVADIVAECSDTVVTPKPPWRERKENYIRHLGDASDKTILVSLADKLDNARAILRDFRLDGSALWQRFTVHDPREHIWYYESLLDVYQARSTSWMVDELDRVLDELKRLLTAAPDAAPTTRPITAADIRAGRIRLRGHAKSMLPQTVSHVDVDLLGTRRKPRWDPRLEDDKGRSGELRFGVRSLEDLVVENEVLTVTAGSDGLITLRRP